MRFQDMIFDWWKLNRRDLPWRHTRDPYRIFISEVMLQQTQASRVLAKYEEFLYFFPDVFALAGAGAADVLRVWKGMGYNRRALYLTKTAGIVVTRHDGKFPNTEKELVALPGVGIYTARAVLVFAFKQHVAAVDTNIRRIITHFFFKDSAQKPSVIQEAADILVPAGKSWEWHQALMDFGALEMGKLNTKKTKKRGHLPFKETSRFYRGRVIDMLREGNVREWVMLKEFADRYDKPEEFLVAVINTLISDGLVQRKKGMLQLPS